VSEMTRYTCEEVFRRLDDYVDRELAPAEMRRVREHLEACAACASEYAFEAGVLDELRQKLRRLDAPSDLLERITARLAGVRERGGSGPGGSEPGRR